MAETEVEPVKIDLEGDEETEVEVAEVGLEEGAEEDFSEQDDDPFKKGGNFYSKADWPTYEKDAGSGTP